MAIETKSSLFRGNSAISVHFQSKIPKRFGVYIAICSTNAVSGDTASTQGCFTEVSRDIQTVVESNVGPDSMPVRYGHHEIGEVFDIVTSGFHGRCAALSRSTPSTACIHCWQRASLALRDHHAPASLLQSIDASQNRPNTLIK